MDKERKFLINTLLHQKRVCALLVKFSQLLLERAIRHDDSKLVSPEKDHFMKLVDWNPTYGTLDYIKFKDALGKGLESHYQSNSHHPEHFSDGVNGMNLLDLVEMFFDWQAASERGEKSLEESIVLNEKRFSLDPQLVKIFQNSVNLGGN